MAESRRMNVAITRAKRGVVVVCDEETINHSKNEFLKRMVLHFESEGEYVAGAHFASGELQVEAVDRAELEFIRNEKENTEKLKAEAKRRQMERAEMDRKEKKRQEVEKQIQDQISSFLAEASCNQLAFSAELSSWARMRVHEIAQQHGLAHMSVGKGAKRQITIKKPNLDGKVRQTELKPTEPQASAAEEPTRNYETQTEVEKEQEKTDTTNEPIYSKQKTLLEGKAEKDSPYAEIRKIQQQKYCDRQNQANKTGKQGRRKKPKSSRLEDETNVDPSFWYGDTELNTLHCTENEKG